MQIRVHIFARASHRSNLFMTTTNGDGDPDLPSGDGNYRCGGE